MSKETNKRLYNCSDSELRAKARKIRRNLERDMADFAAWNITPDTLAAFSALFEAYGNLPTDPEFAGLVWEANKARNACFNEICLIIRLIRNMSDMALKTEDKFFVFDFKNTGRMPVKKIVRHAKRVHYFATTFFDILSKQGLTQEMLDQLNAKILELKTALSFCDEKAMMRILAKVDRITAGNILWAETRRIASIGRSLYVDTDPARYNDYILMKRKKSKKKSLDTVTEE